LQQILSSGHLQIQETAMLHKEKKLSYKLRENKKKQKTVSSTWNEVIVARFIDIFLIIIIRKY
jgi:hypothetical protein